MTVRNRLPLFYTGVVLGLAGCLTLAAQSSAPSAGDRFLPSRSLSQSVIAEPALVQRLHSQSRTAISLDDGNFFGDANRALVTGYAVGGGGAIAVQRGSAQLPRPGGVDAVEPFSQNASFIDVGMRPDFLVSADMNQDGHRDLIVATRGGSQVLVLEGDGHGGFVPQAPFSVSGRIAGVEPWRDTSGAQQIAVAVCRQSCSVDLYQAGGSRLASIPIDDTLTILKVARVNGGAADDIVAGGASTLAVIDGSRALTAQPRVDSLPVWGALAAATGEFVYDARGMMQIAVLTEDGSVHTLARSGIVSTPPVPVQNARRLLRTQQRTQRQSVDPKTLSWVDVETLTGVATFDGGSTPLLIRSRVSGSGMDDLLVLNANGNRITTVRHPVVAYPPNSASPYAGTVQALPARVETGSAPAGSAIAAIPMRVSQDARLGLVTALGGVTPAFSELPTNATLNVNTTADGAVTTASMNLCKNGSAGCTLRSALAVVDADASANEGDGNADTVSVPIGTYTLNDYGPEEPNQATGGTDAYGNPQYHIEIYGPVNLIGANTNTTIIQPEQSDGKGVDKVFSENSGNAAGDNNVQPPIDAYFSGMTLLNGTNPVSSATNQDADFDGGLMDGDTGGTGNITFSSVNFDNGNNPYGDGGGLDVSDQLLQEYTNNAQGNGVVEVSGGTFSNNTTISYGGAIAAGVYSYNNPIDIVGATFTSNSANGSTNVSGSFGSGGAIFSGEINTASCSGCAVTSYIENSTFTSNTAISDSAGEQGLGGAVYGFDGLTVTGNTFIQNTATAGSPAGGQGAGGAIFMRPDYEPPIITGNVFTKNGATSDGGAIWLQAEDQPATVRYNVFYDNQGPSGTLSPASGRTGLSGGYYDESNANPAQDPITATDNFWGCNGPASGTGCDTAATTSGSTITLSPYAEVTASLNTATPATGASIILTGGITQDSNGTSLIGNEGAFAGLPVSLSLSQDGSSLGSSNTNLDGSGSASLTETATAGNGTATLTVYNATVTLNFTSPPVVTSVTPTTGSILGGTSVAISGRAFTGVTQVNFGGTAAATFHFNSDTSISATSPAEGAGTVDITVVTPDGTSAVSTADQFTFTKLMPVITWNPATTIIFGSSGANVLNASATPSGGTFDYSAAPTGGGATVDVTSGTTTLPVGTYNLTATYTPTDTSQYSDATQTVSFTVSGESVWIVDGGGGTSELAGNGYGISPSAYSGANQAVAIDNAGNVWTVGTGSTPLEETSQVGTQPATPTGGGLNLPVGIAIDGNSAVWITNGNGTVSEFSNGGTAQSPSNGFADASLSTPSGIAIDLGGSVWIANKGNNSVTRILGAAAPADPLATAAANNKTGVEP